jgi:hypothetical protein
MANGGKDIKFGHDKRPVTRIEANEQNLFNIANGELLTDEFGTPLITEVDTFFLQDATAKRSTSVVFPTGATSTFRRTQADIVGIKTATYGVYDKISRVPVPFQVGVHTIGGTVSAGSSVATLSPVGFATFTPGVHEIIKFEGTPGDGTNIFFTKSVGISTVVGVVVGDFISGAGIPEGSMVSSVRKNFITINNETRVGFTTTLPVQFTRISTPIKTANQSWKIEESFRETSEVSTTLLGINRAETQLSLFSNVSTYGLEKDSFEFFVFNGGNNFGAWDQRANKTYGNRYNARLQEEVEESGIRLEAFPTPFSYPFGPKFARIGLYSEELFQRYKDFIILGNTLFTYFDSGDGASAGYPADWKDRFLDPNLVSVVGTDVEYKQGFQAGYYNVDVWTDTWRDIVQSQLIDPTDQKAFTFIKLNALLGTAYGQDNTRPGYRSDQKRYSFLQSRRVFRYQPGRISGFTFGLRSSIEPRTGVTLEWGISNPTDQYVFQIDAGQISIIRRSTIPLETDVLVRNGLSITDQNELSDGNPFDDRKYWTIKIPRDKFNGDPLNGNGPSGWNIQPDNVTMYKIEFGWYGAIGARFYVYVPQGNGGARWITVHTLVLENSLGTPCLQDSYFRLRYSLDVFDTENLRQPQFLYKYGASYYIDGGDEGTSSIFSVSSSQKSIIGSGDRTLIGITPKNVILNSTGTEIANKKLIIPTLAHISSDSLAKVQVKTCTACPGFGHVYTPGVASTVFDADRNFQMQFDAANTVTAINTSAFKLTDVGAKVIAPTIYNAYITDIDETTEIGSSGTFETATIQGYGPGLDGYPNFTNARGLAGSDVTAVHATTGITTTVGIGTTYPEPVRLSNYDGIAATDYPLTGSTIEVQFLNPNAQDLNHFSDFIIGLTDADPQTSIPSTLTGFNYDGLVNQTTLPNNKILFGEHTHTYASYNQNAAEVGESYAPTFQPVRMGLDFRIPSVSNPGGGFCSKLTFTVLDPIGTNNVAELNGTTMATNFPESGINLSQNSNNEFYLLVQGNFPAGVDFDRGQVAYEDVNGIVQVSSSRYIGNVQSFVKIIGGIPTNFQFIRVDASLGISQPTFTIFIRPVKVEGRDISAKQKLYNYIPYPLYLVMKLKDNAAINNISIKEKIGDMTKTVSPRLFVLGHHMEVTTANGNADPNELPPTNFQSVSRLSSAFFDIQNEQTLRPATLRDTVFVGENETKSVDMSPIFGQDRNVITPDNNNLEATFFTARRLDGASGTVEATVTFKEQ